MPMMPRSATQTLIEEQQKRMRDEFEKYSSSIIHIDSHAADALKYLNPPAGSIQLPAKVKKPMDDPLQMIAMRMRWTSGMLFPLPHISAYVKGNVAIVFVVNKENKPVCLEDDAELFPSDSLITQLRLLVG
jgi:hypothetical protein